MNHRLFIAIDVPQTTQLEVSALQKKLDILGLPMVWEDPEKLHLTLHFLGATRHEQMLTLIPSIQHTAAATSKFTLTPFFLETLYNRHEPSIIYLGITGDTDILETLQEDLGIDLAKFRLPAQSRFLAHISIGRLKRTDQVATKTYLSKVSEFEFSPLSPFDVDHITLYESFLSRNGSHYQKIGQYKLKYNSQ